MDISGYMAYPVKFIPWDKGNGFTVMLSGVSGVISEGNTKEEAIRMIIDAFALMADVYLGEKKIINPAPKPKDGEELVSIPLVLALKIILRNEMIREGITQRELGSRLGMSPQLASQTFNLCRPRTNVDTLLKAFRAIGKEVRISID
ncbi:MAG: type II toxin-antitoxin system HicB family antitoxin [Succinivibrionaceae bacterium]|nr:type II toxin-antitoxin system HicB family antitoxin [Succinivibrionaceae bacterium]MDY6337316.1 type II toxin-antitoxin system HicB family antitoxin [Succinivibrionaceae bacterium]